MSVINFNTLQKAKHYFDASLTIDDDDVITVKTYKSVKLGVFKNGSEEDKETIYYPANVDFTFTITGCSVPVTGIPDPFSDYINYADYEKEYFNLIKALKYHVAEVIINKDGLYYFKGIIDTQSIQSDFKEKSFTFTIISNLTKLKDMNTRDESVTFEDAGIYDDKCKYYLNGDGDATVKVITFQDMALKIIQRVLPDINQVILTSDVKIKAAYTFLGEPVILGLNNLYNDIQEMVGIISIQRTMIDLLKDILISFGLVMFIEGDKLIIHQRWYSNTLDRVTLPRIQYKKGPAIDSIVTKMKGVQAFVIVSSIDETYEEINYGIVEKNKDGSLKYPDVVEVIHFSFVGGLPPTMPDIPVNHLSLYLLIPQYYTGLGIIVWERTNGNFFLASEPDNIASLYDIVSNKILSLITTDRLILPLTIKGTDWLATNFFAINSLPDNTFRPRYAETDYDKEQMNINLVEC